MKIKKFPHIFVIGNEKGGAGKTTCSMHLTVSLLEQGYKVTTIDVDCRQGSLTRYLENRNKYNKENPDQQVLVPEHFLLKYSEKDNRLEKEEEERASFEKILENAKQNSDFVIVDTPGTHSFLSCLAHSYADTVVTPINDSFVDIDVIAKIDGPSMKIISPSIYSQMVWEQKLEKARRSNESMEWVLVRNRLASIDAQNKKNVAKVLAELEKRIRFKEAPGFGERVIFRELFLQGLTLLDLKKANYHKAFSMSHVAARQELRDFLDALGI